MVKLTTPSPTNLIFGDDAIRYHAKRRRQPRWIRVVGAVSVIVFVFWFGTSQYNPFSQGQRVKPYVPTRPPSPPPFTIERSKEAIANVLKKADLEVKSTEQDVFQPKKDSFNINKLDAVKDKLRESIVDDDEDENAQVTYKDESSQKAKANYNKLGESQIGSKNNKQSSISTTKKEDWMLKLEADLKHVFAIAPDELNVRELLRPIENSGKERLRELGLRARAFRTLFEAWENVHLVHTSTSTHIRDDVVTYLRRAKDLSGIAAGKSRAEIIHNYENVRYFLTKLSALLFPWTAPYFADHVTLHASLRHGGRGIVLSGGDGQLPYLMTSAKTIRKLGCRLPIEVMYLGDEDLGDDARSELEALPGVITRDMKQMVQDEGWGIKGWAGKPFAILFSSFREVVFIDADAQFFVSPEVLFDDPGYVETGALFFRDRLMFPESKRKWLQQILPKPMSRKVRQSRFWTGESGHMQESGVVVVDKWRHFMAMMMVTRMNGPDRDGNKEKKIVGTYDMVYGDKETFWLGWELVGDGDYIFHPGSAGILGDIKDTHGKDVIDKEEDNEEEEEEEQNEETEEDAEKEEMDGEEKEKEKDKKDYELLVDNRNDPGLLNARENEARKAKDEKEKDKKDAKEKTIDKDDAKLDLFELGAKNKKTKDELSKKAADKDDAGSKDRDDTKSKEKDKQPKKDTDQKKDEDKPKKPLRKRTVSSPTQRKPVKKPAPMLDDDDDDDEIIYPNLDSSDRPPATNYTICAPQLLHLDRSGRPLWFNGWILNNKFDNLHVRLAKFEYFMKEQREDEGDAEWSLEKNNICCLKSDEIFTFSKKEKKTIRDMISIAKDVGALGKKHIAQ